MNAFMKKNDINENKLFYSHISFIFVKYIYVNFFLQVDDVELIERRGYLTLRLSLPKEGGKLLLRKTDGIRKWYLMLQVRRER